MHALVAVGSGGLGQAIAATLARDGFDVTLTYRSRKEPAEEAAAAVRAHGRQAEVHALDLADVEATEALVAAAAARAPLDAVVHAAGPYVPMLPAVEVTPADLAAQLAADTVAGFHLLRAAVPRLRETGGALVVLTTTAVDRVTVRDVLSSAPKAALEQLVKSVAAEEGRHGVRANCVAPGVVYAGMLPELVRRGDVPEAVLDAARRNLALRRLGAAEDVAEAVAFLASPRAGWITGQTLRVDGGYAI